MQGKQILHFLHVGKTGGSAIKWAMRGHTVARHYAIYLHPHSKTLKDLPEGQQVFFFVREPIARFISGFYSRRREGRPKTYVPWSAEERKAFEYFNTPNCLAEAIMSTNKIERRKAHLAMLSIKHVRSSYWDWFDSAPYFRERLADIFFAGRQENLCADYEQLRIRLDIPNAARLPTNDAATHRNPPGIDTTLSAIATANLEQWYQADFEFLDLCERTVLARSDGREGWYYSYDAATR